MVNDSYTKITSPYIKKLLIKTKWSNHSYIDELLFLEKYINTSPRSFASAVHLFWLKKKYKEEFLILCKESSIDRYKKELEDITKEEDRKAKEDRKRKKNENSIKNNWIKAGGLE